MRTPFRLLAVLALALAAPALAGEKLIGTITSVAGADTTNATTAVPFVIPFNAKLTVWCTATAYVVTDTTVAASTSTALPLTALEKFPTSTNSEGGAGPAVVTIGTQRSAVMRIMGPAAVACRVFQRLGTE